jgi:methylated-DNA-[protein]-cysteine S-methyltransferase
MNKSVNLVASGVTHSYSSSCSQSNWSDSIRIIQILQSHHRQIVVHEISLWGAKLGEYGLHLHTHHFTDSTVRMTVPKKRSSELLPTKTVYKAPRVSSKPHRTSQDMSAQLALIDGSERTDFEKRVWTALCAIPRGSFTTYALLSKHLGTSPRAVGNALRRNPFAPEVPCHRVVATGGTLGGFKGQWPKDGEGITLDEKRKLLRAEGVKIDERGKVVGTPWIFKS